MDLLSLPLDLIVSLWPIARDVLALLWWVTPELLQQAVLWQFIYLPVLLAAAYPLAIQYERGGWWKLLMPFTLVIAIVDVYLNFTTFALCLWSAPGKKEITFSQHLERLVFDSGWRGVMARLVARYTNLSDPTPPHIPLP
ncbi:hypothetical protein [Hydrogenophaga sp.]